MHLIGLLFAAIAAVAFWVWRARAAAEAANTIIDAADDARAAIRRLGFRRKQDRHPADAIDDPRLAAAGALAAIARMDGDLTEAQIAAIREESANEFNVPPHEAADITAFARWIAGQSHNPDEVLRRLVNRLFDLNVGEAERRRFLQIAARVAAVEGGAPSEAQAQALDRMTRRLTPQG